MCAAAQAEERVVPRSADEVRLSYAPVVDAVAPAVVNIYTRRVVTSRRSSPFRGDPLFERFFGRMFPDTPRERIDNSLGSGVIVSSDGVIVTNHHVVAESDEITVALADRREFTAVLLGADEDSDLAVLKIDTDGAALPALELGDSDSVKVGDIVLAIGNPFGVGQTVTSGIVSAQTRTGLRGGAFIQTDAAINPGNSGGALITLDHQLIGINTAILTRSGGSNGIGFAIPSNLVRVVVEGMVNNGRVVRPWLGVGLQPVTADIARSLGLARPSGLLVTEIHRLSPARDKGLDIGDVVASVDGYEVFDVDGFEFRLSTHRLGETAILSVLSDGARSDLDMSLRAAPEDPLSDVRTLSGQHHPLSGVVVANLSPALARELDIDDMRSGVIVLRVDRGRAARLGLRVGDVIVEVAGRDIDLTATLADVLDDSRDEWPIAIDRDGETLRVTVRQ
jgi:Do/DeqQ family serine protease